MSSMVALEAAKLREAHQSQFNLADHLFIGDRFCYCRSHGRIACRDWFRTSDDFDLCSSVLYFYIVEK